MRGGADTAVADVPAAGVPAVRAAAVFAGWRAGIGLAAVPASGRAQPVPVAR